MDRFIDAIPPQALWILVALALLRTLLVDFDRCVQSAGRILMLPFRLRHYDRERAARIVAEQQQRAALAELVELVPLIKALRDEIADLRQWHVDHEEAHR